ncbi:hypothetical protein ACWGQ4_14520 [Streptomyces sp. NPDC055721]|uniref:hypothetical protein n=1 Tax=Streptomyces sp. NPDC127132 TaxID=3345374 RepID=UPI003636512B
MRPSSSGQHDDPREAADFARKLERRGAVVVNSGGAVVVNSGGVIVELGVYGIDLVTPPTRRPVIVDVNAFPGGVHRRAGAARTLAALALDLISRGPPA